MFALVLQEGQVSYSITQPPYSWLLSPVTASTRNEHEGEFYLAYDRMEREILSPSSFVGLGAPENHFVLSLVGDPANI